MKSTAHDKKSKSFTERVLDVRARSNPGLPKVYAKHLLRDVTAVRGESKDEDKVIVPDDPDTPLIIKIIPSSLKLPIVIKEEVKEEVEGEEIGVEEGTEEIQKAEEIQEVDNDDDTSEDETILDEEDKVNKPEVFNAIGMLQESNKQQLPAYNHLVEAIPSMTDTEVRRWPRQYPNQTLVCCTVCLKCMINMVTSIFVTCWLLGSISLSSLLLIVPNHHRGLIHC